MDELVLVGSPGLQDHHLRGAVGAQTISQHRTGRTGSHDDEISDHRRSLSRTDLV